MTSSFLNGMHDVIGINLKYDISYLNEMHDVICVNVFPESPTTHDSKYRATWLQFSGDMTLVSGDMTSGEMTFGRLDRKAIHTHNIQEVMNNGPWKFLTPRKILPLLDLLGKFIRVLACSCSQNFCSCSQACFLVCIAWNFVNPSLG